MGFAALDTASSSPKSVSADTTTTPPLGPARLPMQGRLCRSLGRADRSSCVWMSAGIRNLHEGTKSFECAVKMRVDRRWADTEDVGDFRLPPAKGVDQHHDGALLIAEAPECDQQFGMDVW